MSVVESQLALDLAGETGVWMRKAAAFDAQNPHVYALLVGYCRQVRAAGIDRIGIELVWNRMRWDVALRTSEQGVAFKLNQNYKAYFARRIMREEPDLADIFETRRLRS